MTDQTLQHCPQHREAASGGGEVKGTDGAGAGAAGGKWQPPLWEALQLYTPHHAETTHTWLGPLSPQFGSHCTLLASSARALCLGRPSPSIPSSLGYPHLLLYLQSHPEAFPDHSPHALPNPTSASQPRVLASLWSPVASPVQPHWVQSSCSASASRGNCAESTCLCQRREQPTKHPHTCVQLPVLPAQFSPGSQERGGGNHHRLPSSRASRVRRKAQRHHRETKRPLWEACGPSSQRA